MKLQAHYNRITIISTFFILLIAAAGYYFLLRFVLISQLDESLRVEEAEIHDYIKKYDQLPPATVYKDQRISSFQTREPGKRIFTTLAISDTSGNEDELSRQLLFPVSIGGKNYMVEVTKSEEATPNLVWNIMLSTTGLIFLLAVILIF